MSEHRRYAAVIPCEILLSGRAQVEVTGGQKFGARLGEIVLAEDLSGEGHTFRVLGDPDWVASSVDIDN